MNQMGNQSILEYLINQKLNKYLKEEREQYDVGCQTIYSDSVMNLEQKLEEIDQNHEKRKRQNGRFRVEDQMEKYKQSLQMEYKLDLEREVARIRQIEISQIKVRESQKHREEMEKYREKIEKQYYEKIEKLRERENKSI